MGAPKLSVAEVLHTIIDRLGLHTDTAAGLHQLVDDNLSSPEEEAAKAAAAEAANPWKDKSDSAVIAAAIAGDQGAAEEYRKRAAKPAEQAPPAGV